MAEERLQKILAKAGYGSRRANEELISAGRVKVNGKVALLGMKADPTIDEISVDNSIIPKEEASLYIALYKPRGILSDNAPLDNRKNVRDLIDLEGHFFTVGRLDMESEGLMILTNDGELTNRLTHPRYGHEKEYLVLVAKRPDEEQLDIWRRGVVLEDGFRTAPTKVSIHKWHGKGAWLNVILREGHKRQIREISRVIGLPIVKLIRVRIASINLGNLKSGEWRYLTPDEVKQLKMSGEGKFTSTENKNRMKKFSPNPRNKKFTEKATFRKKK
ncbi:MAG: pseudouridine synthase [Chloroflexi bacterium HGW-Chloroflexi-3]|nr:MAG: pseudouridine synthase [Chloroflexi bacterium HGW-Chloroflexi-3]